jgi:ribonuclease VapC
VSEYVLDASALLALLNAEKGAEAVQDMLPRAMLSAVNLAEAVSRLAAAGMPEDEIGEALALLGLEEVAFDAEQAFQAGLLFPRTQSVGLSLGDRACLSLAKISAASAVTADRAWQGLDIGVKIILIR